MNKMPQYHQAKPQVLPNEDCVITRYYDDIRKAMQYVEDTEGLESLPNLFAPGFEPPALNDAYEKLFAAARMDLVPLGNYGSCELNLLDLMADRGTNTTKTYPSLLMVARAVEHIRKTGEKIIILVTTSGNKGTALRSAVQTAVRLGLVDKTELRVVMVVPERSAGKLRKSALDEDAELKALNPVILFRGKEGDGVKRLGAAFMESCSDEIFKQHHTRVWYSLDLRNYKIPDAARAFFEWEMRAAKGMKDDKKQLHAHAVSSAFGFIGYHLGRTILEKEGKARPRQHPGYFLVQHLDKPDMVLHLLHGSFDRKNVPTYQKDPGTGMYTQQSSPHFPQATFAVDEVLDTTFYTRTPNTCGQVTGMVRSHGGGGIVVSLYECLQRYALVKDLVLRAGIKLPDHPGKVREWSLIMVFTGVLNAIDRGLIEPDTEITIHGSGFYGIDDFSPVDRDSLAVIDEDRPADRMMEFVKF